MSNTRCGLELVEEPMSPARAPFGRVLGTSRFAMLLHALEPEAGP
jgi:hypothetical protein